MYQLIWEITWLLPRRTWCFIVGHKAIYGGLYEDDFCDRCFIDRPEEKTTMPDILNRCYVWAVEHGWPESVDLWLQKHIRLPGWWEY
jgi:hypothetical protein